MRLLLVPLLMVVLVACGDSANDRGIGSECTTNDDCTLASYHDPSDRDRGCCGFGCEKEIVTKKEAQRRQEAWEAKCSNVRCAPISCTPISQPSPTCRAGRCVGSTTE